MDPQLNVPRSPVYNLLLSGDGQEACHSMIKINGDRKSLIPSYPPLYFQHGRRSESRKKPGEQFNLIVIVLILI